MIDIRRSDLYIPANNPRFVAKASVATSDIVTFDIEDAVPPQEKENARRIARENLLEAQKSGAEVFVRVNGWHTEYTNDDLDAVVRPGLDGVTLPKCRDRFDVKRLDWKISEMEDRYGMEPGSVKIQILLENSKGMVNAYDILTASDRIVAAFFGTVDYCADMRIPRTNLGDEQRIARTIVAHAARAAGVVAMDGPFADYKNEADFRQHTTDGANLGMEGRMIIHPSQIAIAHELYSPSAERIEKAKVFKKFFEEEGLAKGLASVALDGEMIDTPVYVDACEVLEREAAIKEKEANKKASE